MRISRRVGAWVWVWAAAVLALPPAAQAQDGENLTVRCPGRIRTVAGTPAEQPSAGFTAALSAESLTYLTGITVLEGPPDRRTELTPVRQDGALQWTIEPQHERPTVVCRYEGGVVLARLLHQRTRVCVARLSRSDSPLREGTGLDHAVAACH
jgi:hypothetical protein